MDSHKTRGCPRTLLITYYQVIAHVLSGQDFTVIFTLSGNNGKTKLQNLNIRSTDSALIQSTLKLSYLRVKPNFHELQFIYNLVGGH